MRRTTVAAAAAAVAAVCTALGGALAAPFAGRPGVPGHAAAERVQYHSDWRGPRDVEEHRWLHREQLRAYEEERLAEAARGEARSEARRGRARRRAPGVVGRRAARAALAPQRLLRARPGARRQPPASGPRWPVP